MSFFQNPFAQDFHGNWVLGDRKQILRFDCPRNAGRGDELVMAWTGGPWDLSGTDADSVSSANLVIRFALDSDLFKNWSQISIDVTGATPAATTALEVVTALNDDTTFASWFTASRNTEGRIHIQQNKPAVRFRFYILNGTAEEKIRFNARAGVAELPTYFMRHTVGDGYREVYEDAQNILVFLDVSGWTSLGDNVAGDVASRAVNVKGISLAYDASDPKDDYEMLEGRSGIFMFRKNTIDVSDRITRTIEYHAGAAAGDLARIIDYTYDGTDTNPTNYTEIPYTLDGSDLITPP